MRLWDLFEAVSIQLVSPASGELANTEAEARDYASGFHSIGFPSEWGVIQGIDPLTAAEQGFHSIGFPSEWGATRTGNMKLAGQAVSIQLVSPASGEPEILVRSRSLMLPKMVSIQLVSPASGENLTLCRFAFRGIRKVSIQLVSPASGEGTL